jgi:hypothetical protein
MPYAGSTSQTRDGHCPSLSASLLCLHVSPLRDSLPSLGFARKHQSVLNHYWEAQEVWTRSNAAGVLDSLQQPAGWLMN